MIRHFARILGGACVLLPFLMSGSPAAAQTVLASSTFNSNTEGWTVRNYLDSVIGITHFSTGGNPGGFVRTTDPVDSNTSFFVAPAPFLGNKAHAHGGTLAFDLRQSHQDAQYNDNDVILKGGGLTLVLDLPVNPATSTWTNYVVPLSAGGWKVGTLGGSTATEAEMQQALQNMTDLRIRAEYRSGNDSVDLDNVVLTSNPDVVPEGSSWWMLLAALPALALARQRIRA